MERYNLINKNIASQNTHDILEGDFQVQVLNSYTRTKRKCWTQNYSSRIDNPPRRLRLQLRTAQHA